MTQLVQQSADYVVGGGALSLAVGLHYIETGLGIFMLIGGAILVAGRLWLLQKEIRTKQEEK